jgi:multidrug resistance efflux pump
MRRWIIILIVIAALGAAGFFFFQSRGGDLSFLPGQEAPTPTPLPVVQANPDIIVDAIVVPDQYAALSFATGGVVDEVFVEEGARVAADELIARLDNERQVISIAQAESNLESAQARLAELQAGARTQEIEGAQAAVDNAVANLQRLLEGARQEDIAAAEASVAAARAGLQQVLEGADQEQVIAARANLKNAEAELQRAQRAFNDVKWANNAGALPQAAQLQTATNNFEAAQAQLDRLLAGAKNSEIAAAQAQVDQAQAQLDKQLAPPTDAEIAAAEASVRQAQAQLDQLAAGARDETIQAAAADVKSAATALMQQQSALADTELRAPFAGTVASLDLRMGEQVAASAPVVQLADDSAWLVETDDLTEIDVVNVNVGDKATINIDALPELELTGTVVNVKPFGENKQGDITYTVTVAPDEHDERLRWNMTASVRITPQE